MKKLIALVIVFVVIFAGCTQTQQTESTTNEPLPEETTELADEAPYDYEGSWLRTALYINGVLEHQTPAILTLNRTDYVSSGTCENTGKVISEGDGTITITLDSTNCPNVSAGGSVTSSYSMKYDEERDVEVMTLISGPVTETYDRQG